MAQVTLTIANADVDRVLNALGGYQDLIDGQPNPQTKSQFAQEKIITWLKNRVKNHEANVAAEVARAAANVQVDLT